MFKYSFIFSALTIGSLLIEIVFGTLVMLGVSNFIAPQYGLQTLPLTYILVFSIPLAIFRLISDFNRVHLYTETILNEITR